MTPLEIAKGILKRASTQYEGKQPQSIEILAQEVIRLTERNQRIRDRYDLQLLVKRDKEKTEALKSAQEIIKQTLGAFEDNWRINWNDLKAWLEKYGTQK